MIFCKYIVPESDFEDIFMFDDTKIKASKRLTLDEWL